MSDTLAKEISPDFRELPMDGIDGYRARLPNTNASASRKSFVAPRRYLRDGMACLRSTTSNGGKYERD